VVVVPLRSLRAWPLALASVAAGLAPRPALAVTAPPRLALQALEAAPGLAPVRAEITVAQDVVPARRRAAWGAFVGDAGPRWRAVWDTSTDLPLRLYGQGVAAPGASLDPRVAEAHARAFVARHRALLAPDVDLDALELVANDLDAGLRTVAFRQRAGAARLPVSGGQISFRYKNDRLFVIGAELVPGAVAAAPVVDAHEAAKAAAGWPTVVGPGIADAAAAELVALPLRRAGAVEVRTAYRVPLRAGRLAYDVFVDATTGRPVARSLLVRFAQAGARFDVPLRGPEGERVWLAAPELDVDVDGVDLTTDAAGTFSWAAAAAATVTLGVTGKSVRVSSLSGDDATQSFTVEDGADVAWSLADDELGDAQLSGFIHAGVAKARARQIAPGMSFLGRRLLVNVNGDDPSYLCNAYWDGTSVNFFREGSPCNNTARVADVVYHEFGHGFHQHAIIAGAGAMDPALGEGSSDYYAGTITGDPELAPGFFIGGGILREFDGDYRWPEDVAYDPHATGLIYASAMWDLRVALVDELGEAEGVALADALNYAALRRASSIPATYAEILAADDDDGDLANGTPHLCAIQRAFVPHGLTPYLTASGLRLVHDAPSRVPAGEPFTLRASTAVDYPACEGESLERLEVYFVAGNGPVKSLELAPYGDAYEATLPPLGQGVALRYRVEANAPSARISMPDNPADDAYQVFAGETRPLFCTDFEAGPDGFTFGDDRGGAGDFEWGSPGGLAGDPAAAFSGASVLGQALGGDGEYHRRRTSYAESPPIDLRGEKHVRLQLRRWLTVQDGDRDRAAIVVNGKELWRNEGTGEWDGTLHHVDREWRFQDVDLSPVVNSGATSIQVRFELESDGRMELGGWNLDDLCVVAWDPPPPPTPPPAETDETAVAPLAPELSPGGGCACDAAGAPARAPAWSLALVAAAWAARARRRRAG
jgi:hypothetical protein